MATLLSTITDLTNKGLKVSFEREITQLAITVETKTGQIKQCLPNDKQHLNDEKIIDCLEYINNKYF